MIAAIELLLITDVETVYGSLIGTTTQTTESEYLISTAVMTDVWPSGSSAPITSKPPSCHLPSPYSKCQTEWQNWAESVAVPQPMPPATPG